MNNYLSTHKFLWFLKDGSLVFKVKKTNKEKEYYFQIKKPNKKIFSYKYNDIDFKTKIIPNLINSPTYSKFVYIWENNSKEKIYKLLDEETNKPIVYKIKNKENKIQIFDKLTYDYLFRKQLVSVKNQDKSLNEILHFLNNSEN